MLSYKRTAVVLLVIAIALTPASCRRRTPSTAPPPTVRIDSNVKPIVPAIAGLNGGAPRLLGAVRGPDGPTFNFVLSEMTVVADNQQTIDAVVARWHGQELLRSNFGIDPSSGDAFALIRIRDQQFSPKNLASQLHDINPLQSGDLRISSDGAARTLAAVSDEQKRRVADVSLNFLLLPDGVVDNTTKEAGTGAPSGEWSSNAFTWPYMKQGGAQDIGVTWAWRALALTGRTANRVPLMIYDAGGFRRNRDLPKRTVIFPANSFGRPQPLLCGSSPCPFHGTQIASVLVGQLDNSFGVAGPGGQVVDLILAPYAGGVFETISRIFTALGAGLLNGRPRIISLSASTELLSVLFPIADVVDRFTRVLYRSDIVTIAAAGNDGRDVDAKACVVICWEQSLVVPCEDAYVICVGGLQWDSNSRDPSSNYGTDRTAPTIDARSEGTVDIFGPFTTWALAEDPSQPPEKTSGTSIATPFVAGVAAMILAADPTLNVDRLTQILLETAHMGPPGVHRWVNAAAAVRRALGSTTICEPPSVTIISPPGGSEVLVDADQTARGQAFQLLGSSYEALPPSGLTWFDNGHQIGTGNEVHLRYASPGTHRLTLRARGCSAVSRDATIEISAVSREVVFPGVIDIVSPMQGQEFNVDPGCQPRWCKEIVLAGRANYSDGDPVPSDRMRWSGKSGDRMDQFGTGSSLTAKLIYPTGGYCGQRRYDITLEVLDKPTGTTVVDQQTVQVKLNGPPC